MERAFGTLQGRLPQELRIRGLGQPQAANVYLRDVFMANFNARFGVAASEEGSDYVAYVGAPLADALCLQEDVKVWTLSDGQVSVVVGVRRISAVSCHAACSNFSFATGNVSTNVCTGVLP
jgi:hypothetical protein